MTELRPEKDKQVFAFVESPRRLYRGGSYGNNDDDGRQSFSACHYGRVAPFTERVAHCCAIVLFAALVFFSLSRSSIVVRRMFVKRGPEASVVPCRRARSPSAERREKWRTQCLEKCASTVSLAKNSPPVYGCAPTFDHDA